MIVKIPVTAVDTKVRRWTGNHRQKELDLSGMRLPNRKVDNQNPVPDEGLGKDLTKIPPVTLPEPVVPPPFDPRRMINPNTWAGVIRDELDALEADIVRAGFPKRNIRRVIIQKVVEKAQAGEPWAIAFLADREDGKPRQQVGIEGADGGDLRINVVRYEG